MAVLHLDPFEQVIRAAGEGWMIDWYAPIDKALPQIRSLLESVNARGRQRFGELWQECGENTLVQAYGRNPSRIKAFLQALGSTHTEDMLIMVWRVLNGKTIAAVQMNYQAGVQFSLVVSLSEEGKTQPVEEYHSDDIDDAKLVRHFGIMKMSDMPLFDGFYALRVSEPKSP